MSIAADLTGAVDPHGLYASPGRPDVDVADWLCGNADGQF